MSAKLANPTILIELEPSQSVKLSTSEKNIGIILKIKSPMHTGAINMKPHAASFCISRDHQ
jgi:hypothetical protein